MKKTTPPITPETPPAEPANIAVEVLVAGTKIGPARCGLGTCSFPLRMSDAEALQAMGKVRIIGIFTAP